MTTLAQISSGQYNKETVVNEILGALSPAAIFGKKHTTTTGLTWGYYGGIMLIDGVLTSVADGTVALTASNNNYVEATRAGVVSANTTGFTAGRIPLFLIVTLTSTLSTVTDNRAWIDPFHAGSYLSKAFPSDANYTLTAAEARARIIRMTGTVTGTKDVTVPLVGEWSFVNSTSAGSIRIIGASGTGITIANARAALVFGDGTNIVRLTPDNVIT